MAEWKINADLVAYPDAIVSMEARVAAIREENADECVWLLEHPPLYTKGTSAQDGDLIDAERFPVFDVGRGGEFTYHGPGQRVIYVMLDLRKRYPAPDLKRFVCDLEQWVIDTLAVFDIKGERRKGRVGIWVVDPKTQQEAKIAALGIRVRRWVSFYGISINVNPDLEHFSGIVPCGISQHGVTSMQALGKDVMMAQLDAALEKTFAEVFGG